MIDEEYIYAVWNWIPCRFVHRLYIVCYIKELSFKINIRDHVFTTWHTVTSETSYIAQAGRCIMHLATYIYSALPHKRREKKSSFNLKYVKMAQGIVCFSHLQLNSWEWNTLVMSALCVCMCVWALDFVSTNCIY